MYTSTPVYVRTAEALNVALEELSKGALVALDTEFLRERTYYPKFCLLQMAHENYCALFDVLELPDLRPIFDFLNDRSRLKVLHAAHQDLEVLALTQGALHGVPVKPIAGPFFDTQVAAAFLDMPPNMGYADLVKLCLNRTLNKGQARTDWSQRPLSPEQIEYAAADVTYLVHLYRDLEESLDGMRRWEWIKEDALQLEDPSRYVTEPSEAWRRLRGMERLRLPEQRAALKALAAWREEQAIRKNLPRAWIMSDDILRQLADKLPATRADLARIRGLVPKVIERRGEELLTVIRDSKPNAANEVIAVPFAPQADQQKAVKKLMEYVRRRGEELHLSPEHLATRRDIEALVYGNEIGAFGQGWRYRIIGEKLIKEAATAREMAQARIERRRQTEERLAAVQRRFFPPRPPVESETQVAEPKDESE